MLEAKQSDKCKKRQGKFKEKYCFKCKKVGHYVKEYRSVGTNCFRCNEMGHISTNYLKKGNKRDDPPRAKGREF